MFLRPVLVPKPWGGSALADLGRDLPAGVAVGESWDVADLDPATTSVEDPASRVADGPHAGKRLADLVAQDRHALLGLARPAPGGRFPLLVKHLDAREHLSVQVHPPTEVLARHPGAVHKTESWVVVAAGPGAELFLGLREGTRLGDVEAACGTHDLVPLLRRVPARVGDVHHVPAGLVHALGAGVVVAEVQSPSDTTYRMYDWARESGRPPRQLHCEAAMDCVRASWDVNIGPVPALGGTGPLVADDQYEMSRASRPRGGPVTVPARATARVVVVVTGRLTGEALPRDLPAGGVVVLPAAWEGELSAAPGTSWLDVDLPVPADAPPGGQAPTA